MNRQQNKVKIYAGVNSFLTNITEAMSEEAIHS